MMRRSERQRKRRGGSPSAPISAPPELVDPLEDEDFRQERIVTIAQVRRSIVRISYRWKPNIDNYIITGIVISKDGNQCEVLANDVFHMECTKLEPPHTFGITFPTSDESYGVEETHEVGAPYVISLEDGFIKLNLTIPGIAVDYIKPAIFEMGDITPEAAVDVFFFPRERIVTPPIYSPGNIIEATKLHILGVFYADVPVDESAYLGSPLFNNNGHIVGIIYASQSRVRAWGVKALKGRVLHQMDRRAMYAEDGIMEEYPEEEA